MRKKDVKRYGKHEYTTIEASWPETGEPTRKHAILWESEHQIERAHGDLRRAVQRAMRELKDADERLETNVPAGLDDLRDLTRGINTLGILQGTANDVDNNIRALAAAIEAHGRLVVAFKTDVNEPAK